MGELEKEKGAWGYVEGGMGGVSQSIARSARSLGADIFTNRVSIQEEGVTVFSSHCFCAWHIHSKEPVVSRILICRLPGHLQDVKQVLIGQDGSAKGIILTDGTEVHSKVVLSNATPYITFKQLTPQVQT